jgi:diguanylate cyclase (GGDEF)-like protein
MATSLFDVTIVSATMLSYLLQGMPSVTVNGRTTFLAYFIAIGAACLRWDPRICLTAGVTAVVQYTGLVAAAWQTWPDVRTDDVLRFGQFQPGLQFGKLMLLVIFTFLCVVIVHQSRRLRISATHDPLTGLMNRAYFEERLGDELSRAGRHETPLCVALVDIDHFKRVNDTHGHPAGDAALRVVGRVLRRSLRRTDLVSRWGGEEFAIAFPETRLAEAVGKLEQLRLDVASHAISLSTGAELQLTISAGVAATRLDGVSLREIVDAADARLLEAKRAGRNRTVAGQPARAVSGEWRATVTEANS